MSKQQAITIVNDYLERKVLNNQNTHFANINNAKDVWWFCIPLTRFDNDLHLLLNKRNGIIWLKVLANTFENLSNVFRIRLREQWREQRVDLEISSNSQYMVDIKSGGTRYDFRQHIEHEFNQRA